MYNAGFADVQNDMVFFGDTAGSDTFIPYIKNLSQVIATAKTVMLESNLLSNDQLDEALAQLLKWAELKYATAYYPLCIAVGTKPHE